MKKLSVLAAGMLLLLTGCSPAAILVANSFKNTMDLTSYESRTSISVNGHLPDVPEVPIKPVLEVLKSGVVLNMVQKNERESHVSLSVNNPAPILGSEIWPYQTAPSFDSYTNGNVTYIKSSVDKKYLAVTSEAAAGSNAAVSEKMKQFIKAYVNQYDYNPKHLEKVGEEKVALPDGSILDATRVRITLDTQEALDMVAYTLDNLSRYNGLEDLPSLLPTLSEAEKQNMNVTELRSHLSDMAKQIKSGNLEDLKASGFDGKIGLNLWIDKDNQIVQNETNIDFKLPHDPAQRSISDAADVVLTIRNQSWNHNKKLTIDYPSEENNVYADNVKKNIKLLNAFDKSSPNRFLAKSEVLAQAKPFDDVMSDDWAYEPVTMLRQMSIVNGYDNNEFLPERSITRGEFIKMAVDALGLQSGSGNVSFKDNNLIPSWAEQSVQTALKAGLIDGYEDGTLRPNQPISRAEIVTILVKGYHLSANANYSLTYTDRNEIPDWSVNYVRTAASKGLVDGYDDGSFAPKKQAKRSEVASILYKAVMM